MPASVLSIVIVVASTSKAPSAAAPKSMVAEGPLKVMPPLVAVVADNVISSVAPARSIPVAPVSFRLPTADSSVPFASS